MPPERLPEGLARRVVGRWPMATAHFITAPIRCRTRRAVSGLSCQIGGEDGQDVGCGHLGHGHRPDARKRIGAQTARPVPRVLGISPAGALLRQHLGGGLLDRGHALAVALLGQRVSARPSPLAVRERHVARLGQ